MVTKLIPIFTVAGVVAAGSVAYAINAQSLKSETKSPAGTATLDLRHKQVIIQPKNPAGVKTTSENIADVPVPGQPPANKRVVDATPGVQAPNSGDAGQHTFDPGHDQVKGSTPAPTESATSIPVLPPAPPGFKPGQGDDGEGEDDGQGSGDHEDSNDSHSQLEHDDD